MRGFTSMQTPFWTVRHSLQFTTLGSVRWKVLWPTAATFQGLSLGVLQVSGSCCNTTHVSTTCLLAYKVSKRAASCRELAKHRSNCSWGSGRDRRNARRLIGSVIREEGLTYLQNWLSPSSKRTRTATGGAATNTAAWRCCRWRTSHACCSEALLLLLSGHNPKLLQLLLLLFVPILTVSPVVLLFNFIAAPAFELNKDPSPAQAPPRKPMLQGTRKAQNKKNRNDQRPSMRQTRSCC
jgi:hypothetical protein